MDAAVAERRLGGRDHVAVDADRPPDAGCVGSSGSGTSALAQSERTLPGVSEPSSVVRSIMLIAGVDGPGLARRLDRAGAEAGDAALAADLVDAGEAVEPGREGAVRQA